MNNENSVISLIVTLVVFFAVFGFGIFCAIEDRKQKEKSAICMFQNHNERDFCKLWKKCYDGEPPKKYCKIRYKTENPK